MNDDATSPWGSWPDPAALQGLVPAVATPAGALLTLLRGAARRLVGRRFTVPGTGGGLSLRLESLQVRPDAAGLALGQLDDVRVVAGDVRWRGLEAQRVVLVCRNLHVRPLPRPTAVAAPVTLEVSLSHEVVGARVAAARPALIYDAGDEQAQLRWAARPTWGALVVRSEVTADELVLRPGALRIGRRLLGLPSWVPVARITLPRLPRGLRLQNVVVEQDGVTLHLLADEWREPVPTLLDLLA